MTVRQQATISKLPKRLSTWWALEFPDHSLEHEGEPEDPQLLLTLFRRKEDAEAARRVYREVGVPPYPTVVSIVIS